MTSEQVLDSDLSGLNGTPTALMGLSGCQHFRFHRATVLGMGKGNVAIFPQDVLGLALSPIETKA